MVNNLRRSLRNVLRNGVRTVVVAVMVGMLVVLALAAVSINAATDSYVSDLEATVGTGITIRPAMGFEGMFIGEGPTLDADVLSGVDELPNIVNVQHWLMGMLPRIPAGFGMDGMGSRLVFGVDPQEPMGTYHGGVADVAEIVAGRGFQAEDDGQSVLIAGVERAARAGWEVGETVFIEDIPFALIGIVDAGVASGNRSVYLPLSTAQALLGQQGQISQAKVTVDAIENVATVAAALTDLLGSEVDVITEGQTQIVRVENMLSTIRATAHAGLMLSYAAAGFIIFATMVLIVRERAREIGILKAIGASRVDIAQQYAAEAVALTAMGAVVGAGLFMAAAEPVMSHMLAAGSPAGGQFGAFGTAGPGTAFVGGAAAGITALLGDLEVAISWTALAQGLLGTVLVGLLGGLIPAAYAAQMRPAEVLRNE